MFTSILEETGKGMSLSNGLICTGVSLVLGFVIAIIYMQQGKYTKNFVVTLVILPVLVQMVIMMASGNLGTSVAVLGTFSLVRFRSVPGTSKEISNIFFAMAVGLATGMGYLTFAVLITLVVGLALLLMVKTHFADVLHGEKEWKVLIPENLDYSEIFDDIFAKYECKFTLERVRTTNLGSMYELVYYVKMKDESKEKDMMDEMRCRNGNLTISCMRVRQGEMEL